MSPDTNIRTAAAQRIAALPQGKRELLSKLLKQEGRHSPLAPIPRREPSTAPPLSFAQERLWFLDQLAGGSAFYNVDNAFHWKARLDVRALERSLNEIVRRHEALRTTFGMVNGEPVQIVAPALAIPLTVTDFTHLPPGERDEKALRLATTQAIQPFDLASGPLVRAGVVRLGDDDHLFLLTIHHIVADGWSMGVLFRELMALYAAFAEGKPSPLPELPIQYADFAVWQRRRLQGEVLEEQLGYWKRQLDGLPVLELPTDRPRPPVERYVGGHLNIRLPERLSGAVRALTRREGTTLFITLLTAFQILLHRYSGQNDIVVGSPMANRTRREIEGLIGFFVNTLVMRVDLSGNPTFRDALQRVREVALGAYAHQDLPFERLVQELQPERNLSRNPLFQVLFQVFSTGTGADAFAGRPAPETGSFDVAKGTSIVDLGFHLFEGSGAIEGSIEYSTDLFDRATIARMVGHFRTLLEAIVEHPDRRISELPLLAEFERRQVLVDWNATAAEYPRSSTAEQLFEAQVERTPNAVALRFGGRELTYRELSRRTNQVARYLRRLGAGPESLVALCAERSFEAIVGLLGILKAGAAYVPLDAAYPGERLAFMLSDSRAAVLLTQEELAMRLPASEARVVCLDRDWPEIARESAEGVESGAHSNSLAYVMYTSGSTGVPKGVEMPHRALVNLITWQLRTTALAAPARTLQFSPLSFDVSFQEIFTCLCSGGTLVLVSEEQRRDARELLRLIADSGVERLFLPFVALRQLAEVGAGSGIVPTALREVITAGEQLLITPEIVRWFERLDGCVLSNQYGPTEAHVVSEFRLTGAPRQWPGVPPVGCPIANARLYILDRFGSPAPVGVPGELHIGGDCVARGYRNQSGLTAERFTSDPFSESPGARLYKTGDRARYLPDGNIEFLGRIDTQIKLRGYRIELGEVETALTQHPSVRQAVCTVLEDVPGAQRLVAYVLMHEGAAASPAELRRFVAEKLPEYMVPSTIVQLDTFPLTASGKLDRRALPRPGTNRADDGAPPVPVSTATELSLAAIWADVLKLQTIGANDNFFELGGHSLLATQVVSRMRDVFRVDLPLRTLFENPRLGELARAIDEHTSDDAGSAGPIPHITEQTLDLNQLSDADVDVLLKRLLQDNAQEMKQ